MMWKLPDHVVSVVGFDSEDLDSGSSDSNLGWGFVAVTRRYYCSMRNVEGSSEQALQGSLLTDYPSRAPTLVWLDCVD